MLGGVSPASCVGQKRRNFGATGGVRNASALQLCALRADVHEPSIAARSAVLDGHSVRSVGSQPSGVPGVGTQLPLRGAMLVCGRPNLDSLVAFDERAVTRIGVLF